MALETAKRKYELKKRAADMAATRQRITEAAMELHGTVGPARTTMSAVAERAGVQRHTVYRHFPDEDALFAACSAHFAGLHPLPDTEAWRAQPDPAVRLEKALEELYAHYEQTAQMMTNVLRDAELVASVPATLVPFQIYIEEAVRLLGSGWGVRGARRTLLLAIIRHAVDFRTWESLIQRGGISHVQAARLMRALAEDALRVPSTQSSK
jgi:AcrR family transcriptional regulator